MSPKSVLSLGAAASFFVAAPKTGAQPLEGDIEPPEVRAYIDHARTIVDRIKAGLRNCTVEGDEIKCAAPKGPPMECVFKKEMLPPGSWPPVRRATLDCELDETRLGLGLDYPHFPVFSHDYAQDIDYHESRRAGADEVFALWVPKLVEVASFMDISIDVTSAMVVSLPGECVLFHGHEESSKRASSRVNKEAMYLMSRINRMVLNGGKK